jgi:type I restriction enzyme R subunit
MPILERRSAWKAGRFRLGSVDFEKLAQFFSRSKHKPVAAEVMASAVRSRVDALVRQNPTRKDLRERLEQLLAEYNEGAQSAHEHLDRLVAFAKKLEEEEQRAGTEGLDQERLAFHDLLLAPGLELSAKDRETLKSIARGLPAALGKKLVIDWRKTQRARAAVKAAIRDALDALPEAYGPEDFDRLVEAVYEHVFESYWGEGKSKYGDS